MVTVKGHVSHAGTKTRLGKNGSKDKERKMNKRLGLVFISLALVLLMASAAFAETKPGNWSAGVTGNLWLTPTSKITGDYLDFTQKDNFSGGMSLFGEYAVLRYLAVGAMFDVVGYDVDESPAKAKPAVPLISIDASIKGFYEFGPKKEYQPYLKFAFGYTAFVFTAAYDKQDAQFIGLADVTDQHGWNVKVLPGFQYNINDLWGALIEIGWVGAGFDYTVDPSKLGGWARGANISSAKHSLFINSMVINIGGVYKF